MLASLGKTVKRDAECDKRDTTSRGHRMNNAHTWIEDVAVDAGRKEYNAEDIEIVCGDTSTLNVLCENEIDRAIRLRERICACLRAGDTGRCGRTLALRTYGAPAVCTHCCCFIIVCFAFHSAR
jgi:hypothetical protein